MLMKNVPDIYCVLVGRKSENETRTQRPFASMKSKHRRPSELRQGNGGKRRNVLNTFRTWYSGKQIDVNQRSPC
ncbi:hypothetical protein TNCV_1776801 [Trichonephila clavipes]|nr:hypothetical protein TNCV_1776801 [Trichonephila clavipes]